MFIATAAPAKDVAPEERNVPKAGPSTFRSHGAEGRPLVSTRSINISLERQEKLGVSDWVKVPVEKV